MRNGSPSSFARTSEPGATEIARRLSKRFFKAAIKVALICKSNAIGDLRDSQGALLKQAGCFRQADMGQVGNKIHPGGLLKKPRELCGAHSGQTGGGGYRDRPGELAIEMGKELLKARSQLPLAQEL